MPVVQRIQRQVDTAALPGARLSAVENEASSGVDLAQAQGRKDQAIAGFGATVGALGTEITKQQREAADREKDRADQVAVLNASNQLAMWENQRLYDPNGGALAQKGQGAFDLPEKVGDEYQKLTSDVEAGLGNDRQKEAFQRVKLQRGAELDLTLRRHVYGEMQRYEAGELQAFVDNSVNTAIAHADEPRRIGVELGNAVGAVRTHAKNLGLGPEQVDQQIENITTKTHVGVIENLLAKDQTKAAQVYFEETKGDIKGEALARIEKAVEEGTLRKQAQTKSDEILGAGGTLTEQLEKARGIDDPKLRDEVQQRIEHNATVKDRAEREQEQATLKGVYDTLDKTHTVTSIPPGVWANMDPGQRSSARSYAEHLAKGVGVETDFPTYYGLMQKAAHDPESFATENLLNYRAKIGDTELKQLTEIQGSIVKGDRAQADKQGLGDVRTHEQLVNDSLNLYGIDPKEEGKNSAEGKAIAQLRGMLDARVSALSNMTGKKPTNDDIQKTLDQILSQTTDVPGSWWNIWPGGKAGPFGTDSKRLIDLTIEDVPALDKDQIGAALKRKGRPVSDATILSMYIDRKARGIK